MTLPEWLRRLLNPPEPEKPADLAAYERERERVKQQCGRLFKEKKGIAEAADTIAYMAREMAEVDPVKDRWPAR